MDKHIKTDEKLDRNELIKGNKKDRPISTRIPLEITYNRFLPNISKIIRKNWNILSVNRSLKNFFQNEPVTAFKRNKNFKELIDSNKIQNSIVKKINKNTLKPRKCSSCFGNSRTVSCNKVTTTSIFKNQQTQKTYMVFHEIDSSSVYVIYLMEYTLCKKQYVRKVETVFNIRLNNHRNDVKNAHPKTILLASKHIQEKNHNFNKHAKFIITDKLTNTRKPKEILRQRLIQRENF